MKWFVNLRVKAKLLTGFTIVIVFAIILAVMAIISINNIDDSYTYLLEFPQKRFEYLMEVNSGCISMRQSATAIALNAADSEKVNSYWNTFTKQYAHVEDIIGKYIENSGADTVRDTESLRENDKNVQRINQLLVAYNQYTREGVETALATGDITEVNAALYAASATITEVTTILEDMLPKATQFVADASNDNTKERDASTLRFVITQVIIIIIAIVMAIYIARMISKPLITLTDFMSQAGESGNIAIKPEDAETVRKLGQSNDEIGQCISSTTTFMNHITKVSEDLGLLADGDLTVQSERLSDKDVMGTAVQKIAGNFSSIFNEIRVASDQVASGAGQVSQGAQQLASGTSEQAATVEEFSASLNGLQEKTSHNAENSKRARDTNIETVNKLEACISSMGAMLNAMKEISDSSDSITKVIKVIDDIAFQTNILALNAAVEAARAGQHGKGFAVVAEEVRNLAAKSAEAAKETAALIESSSARVKEGNQIVAQTNSDLEAAAENSRESTRLIDEVSTASVEQASAIKEISIGIEQISVVVQANSATSEESASTSQEMSAQALVLNEILSRFKINHNETFRSLPSHSPVAYPDTHDFTVIGGKY